MGKILLGKESFTVIRVIDLTEMARACSKRIEEGFNITDHIMMQPAEFEVQLTLIQDEVSKLKQLYEAKKLIEFVCDFGVYENMLIEDLKITQGGSVNTFSASIKLKQVLVAKAKTIATELPVIKQIQATPTKEQSPGGKTAIPPYDGWMVKYVNEYNEKSQEQEESLLDKVVGFVKSLFGWS